MKVQARNLKQGDVIMSSDGPLTVGSVLMTVKGREGGSIELEKDQKVDVLRKSQ